MQAVSGLTFTSALPGEPPAGWGYSYMDHTGGYYMAMAVMLALIHRQRTGEGQWVDLASTEAALTLHGPALLDWTANGRPTRQEIQSSSNRNQSPLMAPHGIYPCTGDDEWVAIACRNDDDWRSLGNVVGEAWCRDDAWADGESRARDQDRLDAHLGRWTAARDKSDVADALLEAGVPASAVRTPEERIDKDLHTADFGLWPTVTHGKMGRVRVDGQPVRFSETNWRMTHGGPCLGEHTEEVLERLLGLSADEVARLREEGVV